MEATNNKPSTFQRITQIAGLLLLLVVLPGGSWFYLRNGLDYRIEALEELEDIGKVPSTISIYTQADENPIDGDYLKGKVTVAGYIPEGATERNRMIEVLSKLHEQFDERDDVVFLSYVKADSTADLKSRAVALNLVDGQQWRLAELPASETLEFYFKENYHFPDVTLPLLESIPYVALVDTSLMVRHFYNCMENKDMGRLVEHIALILPRKPEKDIIFQPEKEK